MKTLFDKRTILLLTMIITVLAVVLFTNRFMNKLESDALRAREIEVFKDALAIVQKNYIQEIQEEDLIKSALEGIIENINTSPISIKSFKDKKEEGDINEILERNFLDAVSTKDSNWEELKEFKDVLTVFRKSYFENRETDVQSKDLIYAAIKGMVKSLDTHSDFMTPQQYKEMQVETKGEFGGIGIKIDKKQGVITVTEVLEETPAFRAGIERGDKIIMINNEFTKDMSIQEAVEGIRGTPSTPVSLTIFREGWKKPEKFTLKRDNVSIQSLVSKMLDSETGYIRIYQFQKQTASAFTASLLKLIDNDMKYLVLDLRNNPGGLLHSAVDIVSHFIPSGKLVVSIKDKNGKVKDYLSHHREPYLALPLVVIIDGESASASEIVAGALKDWHRAVIIGTKSYGKGSVQTVVPLKDGSALKLTTARYYTPKGISIEGRGITPDLIVKPKIGNNKDEYICKAMDLLRNNKIFRMLQKES